MTNKNSANNFSEIEFNNIARIKRFYVEVFNERRTETIHEILSSDLICHYEHETMHGRDDWKEKLYDVVTKAIPDFNVEVADIMANGDHIVARWKAQGVHEVELFGAPPSGNNLEVNGMDWVRIVNGQVVEVWNNWNISFLFRQLFSEVKELRWILPMCSFCKKIRDDNGYWEQVDVYIHKYSKADISHGICPECMKEHYPDINLE